LDRNHNFRLGGDAMKISKITKFRTEDGTEHSTREMAEQFILNAELLEILGASVLEPQDILNTLSSHRQKVRDWLNACDAMEKAALR
jgi:hypothetical protein